MQIVLNEPLTQVVFVHDYFQLVFHDEILSVYNVVTLQVGIRTLTQGEHGFCDELVALIGQETEQVGAVPGGLFGLRFASGVVLSVLDRNTSASPEAYCFSGSHIGFVAN